MAVNVTKADMEQLLVELGPVPKLMGQLSDRLDRQEHQLALMRESQVRVEESTATTKERLTKINGNMVEALRCGQENKERIAVLNVSADERFKTLGDKISDLKKATLVVVGTIVGYFLQNVLSRIFG